MGRRVFLCMAPVGGPCPRCGRETEKDYTGARHCMKQDGGCGWSDWEPRAPMYGSSDDDGM